MRDLRDRASLPIAQDRLSTEPAHARAVTSALSHDEILRRNNVQVTGQGPPIVFAHGFGCNQDIWRFVAPAFADEHTVILYDLTGMGASDKEAYDVERHGSLKGHADDLIEICEAAGLSDVVLVGHSVSAIICALAVIERPGLFSRLVMVNPSPCYINQHDYFGGFSESDIASLVETLDQNYLGWSKTMAPVIMGNPDRPELAQELTNLFCQNDPNIARHFARVTFGSDNREDLAAVRTPTLVLQSARDTIAPVEVGTYVQEHLPDGRIEVLETHGHCVNLSAPRKTVEAIRRFLQEA